MSNYGLMQLIGGVDNDGNQEVIKVIDGVLQTSSSGGGGSGGDASAANQTAVFTNAGSDATKAIAVQGITGGKTIPVSLTTLPAFGSTPTFNIGTISTIASESTLSTLNTKIPSSLTVTSTRLLVDGSGVTQPVSITTLPALGTGTNTIGSITNTIFAATQSGSWNLTNISGTVSLPTGAATSAKQDSLFALFPTSLGSKTAANSLSTTPATDAVYTVTGLIASNTTDSGNPIKIGGIFNTTRPTFTDGQRGNIQISSRGGLIADYEDYVTTPTNISAADSASSSAAGANGQTIVTGNPTNNSTATLLVSGNSSYAVQVSGTWVGTLQFERSLDGGTTWTAVGAFAAGTNFIVQTTTSNGNFHGNCSASNGLRVRATAWTSGTASIRILAGQGTGTITVGNPIRLFDAVSSSQATIKPASTSPVFTDTALVVAIRELELGFTSFRTEALTNTPVAVKASSGSLRGWNFINVNSVTVYVKFYDTTAGSTTVGTTTPVVIRAVPGGTVSNPGIFFQDASIANQFAFTTAITMACVTGLADSNSAAPTTPIYAGVQYK